MPLYLVLSLCGLVDPHNETVRYIISSLFCRQELIYLVRACQWQSLHLNVSLSDARPSVFSQYILDVKLPKKPRENLRSQAALCR